MPNTTKTIAEVRAYVLACLEMTEADLGTAVLEIDETEDGWSLRYADSGGTFEGSVSERSGGTLGMEWGE